MVGVGMTDFLVSMLFDK